MLDIRHTTELDTQGWTIIPRMIGSALTDTLCAALVPSLALRDEIRQRKGLSENNDGTLHHLLMDARCYVDLLASFESLDSLFKCYFDGHYILNSYGGVINERTARSYVQNVHRDIRFSSDAKRFMLNALVMLDDFTEENGATYLLSGSQRTAERPDDTVFHAHAARATGMRGSILLFDSRLWHAAGRNATPLPRRALTLTFTCPFFKPQLDYPRLFGYHNSAHCNTYLKQVIGFNARVPATLDEFYAPPDARFYQRGQD